LVTWRTRGLQRVVNVEQAPKRIMRKPTLTLSRGRLAWPVKRAVKATGHSAGVMTAARVYREIDATREVLGDERRCLLNRQPARVRPGRLPMSS
jgi:hypothetical protein